MNANPAKKKTRQATQPELAVAPGPATSAEKPPTPIGRIFILASLTRVEVVEKMRNGHVFLFNDLRMTLNRALGELLVVLSENLPIDQKPLKERRLHADMLVDWKHRNYVMERLGIGENCYRSRLRRLRQFLLQNFGADLILAERKRNARLRLSLRRIPGFTDLATGVHVESKEQS